MTLSQWQSMGYDLHSMIADPEDQIFVNHSTGNFHLLQNAQAVDGGTSLVLPIVFEDLDNISRPQGSGFDIGCYEYTGTTEVIEENIPQTFQLFQNYPNPFNPKTNIGFRIASASGGGFVSLKVYDILGNVVATLVDEYKPAGNFQVTFNPAGLSSGVYYYRLIADDFIQTKCMLLIK